MTQTGSPGRDALTTSTLKNTLTMRSKLIHIILNTIKDFVFWGSKINLNQNENLWVDNKGSSAHVTNNPSRMFDQKRVCIKINVRNGHKILLTLQGKKKSIKLEESILT